MYASTHSFEEELISKSAGKIHEGGPHISSSAVEIPGLISLTGFTSSIKSDESHRGC